MIYELRQYHLHPGTAPLMLSRFRRVIAPIFVSVGMQLLNAWTERDVPDSFFLLAAFPDEADRQKAWEAYHEHELYTTSSDDLSTFIDRLDIHLLDAVAPSIVATA